MGMNGIRCLEKTIIGIKIDMGKTYQYVKRMSNQGVISGISQDLVSV